MLAIKNIQFTKLLKAEGSLREFNFRKTVNAGKTAYSVDVTDSRNNRISFLMQKEEGNWKIQPQQLPSWITQSEGDLHNLIEEESVPAAK